MERAWLSLATLGFLASSGWGIYALGSRRPLANRYTFALTVVAFLCQTIFLSVRGQAVQRCPIGNLYETLAFFSWALVFTYLIIGSTYRMSILGAFTSPVAFLINFSVLSVIPDLPRTLPKLGWRLELHATLALLGLAILGLAAVAATAYIIQERQLKRRLLSTWFYNLPNVGGLESAHFRLLLLGFVIFTSGAALGFSLPASARTEDWVKIGWSFAVSTLYASLIAVLALGQLSHKKAAWISLGSFVVILLSWVGVNALSTDHEFWNPPALTSNTEMPDGR